MTDTTELERVAMLACHRGACVTLHRGEGGIVRLVTVRHTKGITTEPMSPMDAAEALRNWVDEHDAALGFAAMP